MKITKVTYQKTYRKQSLDIRGMRFGKLVAIEFVENSPRGNIWLCKCDCGGYKKVITGVLRLGSCKSCGCISKMGTYTHGMENTRQYRIWGAMKSRCDNYQRKDYGERGIKYSQKWKKFENFWNDMQEGYADNLSLERRNNDGNYTKSNCKWATRAEQSRNKRNNVWVELDGVKMLKGDLAKKIGTTKDQINHKLRDGYSMEQIITHYQKGLPKGTRIKKSLCLK